MSIGDSSTPPSHFFQSPWEGFADGDEKQRGLPSAGDPTSSGVPKSMKALKREEPASKSTRQLSWDPGQT